MRKIILLSALLPLASFAQNPFTVRTQKNPKGHGPVVEAIQTDGRQSQSPGFLVPMTWQPVTGQKNSLQYYLRFSQKYGLPHYLKIYQPKQEVGFGVNDDENVIGLQKVLADLPALFGWDMHTRLVLTGEHKDDLGISHHRYQQYIQGVKVKGGQWIAHSTAGRVNTCNGRIYPSTDIDITHRIDPLVAESKAFNHIVKNVKAYKENAIKAINRTTIHETFIDFEIGEGLNPKLVYVVEVRPTDMHHYNVWVDANTGDILKVQDELCSIDGPKTASARDLNNISRTVHSYQKGNTYYMVDATKSMWTNSQPSDFPDNPVGAIWTIDANNTAAQSFSHVTSNTNTWSDKSAVSAHYNAGLAFDYFKNTHSRNSINGSGGSIISVVNVADDGGGGLDNAYWNGQAMFYGNGASAFTPLAGALDVAGHELTHGVVSNTANLEYNGQSGAINESMADVFGAMIDRDDWKMGEDVVKTSVFSSGALRDLQDPRNGGNSLSDRGYQPDRMSVYYTGSQDNFGVHINSGIVNRAYYLTATGTGMSKNKAEKIWYRALVRYLTSRSQFIDLRYACVDAAKDLYGTAEMDAVKKAFDTVEIYDPNEGNSGGGGSGGGSDIPSNTGTENIISVDVNPSDVNTFYKSSTAPDNYEALTQRGPKRKCSVTDDGTEMFYVSDQNLLYKIILSSPFTETQLSNDLWDNVAVSKDGKRVACISTEVEPKIWLYDFDKSEWNTFTLYNPTYSEGVSSGNVNYADAIEFDVTGEYLLYDAQNEIENASGANLIYWDVGILRVWNNKSNSWGDGKVEKVFTQFPEGISIGNATYAKNSPQIIAFDYIDENSNSYSVAATNMVTNTTATVHTQDRLGFPNYSNQDDKLIFDAENSTTGDDVIGEISLQSDKINPVANSAFILIPDAKWGVWYANGSRNLLSDKKELISFSFPSLSGSPQGMINGNVVTVEVPTSTDVNALTPSFTHSQEAEASVDNVVQVSGVNSQNFSNTVTYTITAQDGSKANYTVRVTHSVGINNLQNSAKIYPNPTTGLVVVDSKHRILSVKCLGIDGTLVRTFTKFDTIDLSNLSTGLYFLAIETNKGAIVKRVNKL